MSRIIIISDIHGCAMQLDLLLDMIRYNSTLDQLILLGDYVDRGPNSNKQAVNRAMELVQEHHN